MSRRSIWTVAFLSVTAAALGMEIWAGFDNSSDTVPWTEYIATWWPAPVTFALISILTVWIGPHFVDAYRKRGTTVVEQIPVPPSKEADARNRAWRTLWQQLGIDVLVAVVLAVGPQLIGQNTVWTKSYLITMGVLAAKTAIATIVAYVARKVVPPVFSPDREVAPAVPQPTAAPELPGVPEAAWEGPKHVAPPSG
jgi:hypothetical protein